MSTEHLLDSASDRRPYNEIVDDGPGHKEEVGVANSSDDALADDLGWGLGTVFRAYVKAAHDAVADLPGGPRGYQVLSAAAQGAVGSQLALAQHLGVDRTVMTYLLDDLEAGGLIERRPDPADRRARRIVATQKGNELLTNLNDRLRAAEALVLVFPVWFDGLPAILQGYFQRVFLPGVAIRIDEAGLFHPNLHHIKSMALAPRLCSRC